MISREKLIILGTVPVVMIINLSLLNYFFGDKIEKKQTKKIIDDTVDLDFSMSNYDNTAINPVSFNTDNTIMVLKFPTPPAHTFDIADADDIEIAEEEAKINRVGTE